MNVGTIGGVWGCSPEIFGLLEVLKSASETMFDTNLSAGIGCAGRVRSALGASAPTPLDFGTYELWNNRVTVFQG